MLVASSRQSGGDEKTRNEAKTAARVDSSGRQEKKRKRRGGGPGAGLFRWWSIRLVRPRVSAPTSESGPWSREIRLEEGTNQKQASLLGGRIARGDHLRPTTSRGR